MKEGTMKGCQEFKAALCIPRGMRGSRGGYGRGDRGCQLEGPRYAGDAVDLQSA